MLEFILQTYSESHKEVLLNNFSDSESGVFHMDVSYTILCMYMCLVGYKILRMSDGFNIFKSFLPHI